MKVLYYEVGKEPQPLDIENDLPILQKLVGGYIECVRLTGEFWLVCNEEGKVHGLRPNRWLPLYGGASEEVIHGNFFICSSRGPDLAALSEAQIELVSHIVK